MDKKTSLEKYVDDYLNENFEGRYRSTIDTENEEDDIVLSIAFEKESERPEISHVINYLVEEAEIQTPEPRADYIPGEGIYHIKINESED